PGGGRGSARSVRRSATWRIRSARTRSHEEAAVNFAFSEEQEALRETVRKFMDDKSPSTEVRRLMETTEGYDPAVWNQMGQEMGLQGLHIPEEYGGQGFSFIE